MVVIWRWTAIVCFVHWLAVSVPFSCSNLWCRDDSVIQQRQQRDFPYLRYQPLSNLSPVPNMTVGVNICWVCHLLCCWPLNGWVSILAEIWGLSWVWFNYNIAGTMTSSPWAVLMHDLNGLGYGSIIIKTRETAHQLSSEATWIPQKLSC